MASNSKNIGVNPGICMDNRCDQRCNETLCELCTPCMDETIMNSLHQAFREHVRRGGYKRIFPSKPHFNEDFIAKLSTKNQIATKWFKVKCEYNRFWC